MPNAHTTARQLAAKSQRDESRYQSQVWGGKPSKAQIMHLLRENGSLAYRLAVAEKENKRLKENYTASQFGG